MRKLSVVLLAIAILAIRPVPSIGQDAAALERRVDSLFAQHQRGLSPGVAVVVVRDGEVVFRKGYGYASLEHRVPITTSTVFDAASVSKQFAGLAVQMLVEQGKLALSDDIRKYIPEMHAFDPPITIEHLLHHTSGLRDWPGMLQIAGWRFDDVITFEHILRFAQAQRTLNFPTGTEHTYSNTNYNLLAEIVARVTGRSFRAWTDENIFRPLGMTSSHFRDNIGEVFPNRAFSYTRAPDSSWRAVGNGLLAQGSSSLFTTADDLAKWLVNLGTRSVGGAAVERMLVPGKLNDGKAIKYASGVLVDTWRGIPMITHNGGWAGFSTFTVYFPRQRGAVVVLANMPINPDGAGIALSSIFFSKHLEPEATPVTAAGTTTVAVAPSVLDGYAGVYKLGPAWYVRIRRDGDALRVRATQEAEVLMTPRSEQEFWVDAYRSSMTFQRDSAGRVTGLLYRGRHSPKIEAIERPLRLADYAGVYESDELSVTYDAVVRDTSLVIHNFRRGSFPLTRAFGDDFRSVTISVEFERDASGQVTGFLANMGPRNRNVQFTKRR
jgi:CubicO group peptidase (beta-lactamase class C family)